jgi:thiamine biosynthesis lipoprotein
MKRRSFVGTLGAGLAGAFSPLPRLPLPRLKRERFVERWSWVMGQAVHVMVYVESEDQGLEGCANALAKLRRLESILSLFDDASELCELNRRAGKGPLKASKSLWQAVYQADHIRKFTEGAFNPAVEPLMRVWGFHQPRRTMPSPTELAAAREAVATATVSCFPLSLPNAHTKLDLGGIAVGYSIDEAMDVLIGSGIGRALIDVSGDCRGMGAPPDEPAGWPVQIAGSTRVVRLRDNALATSSNKKSVVELEKRILGHVMDPDRGCPVDTRRQVTQVAPCAVLADALSTAALVSGRVYEPLWSTYFSE